MATLFDPGIFSVVGVAGNALVGARLFWFATGTETPVTTYTNQAASIANTNPVVADGNGRFGPIWLNTGNYRIVLTSSAGVVLVTRDPYVVDPAAPTIAAALNAFLAGSSPLPIANGGTASTTAVNALTALGAFPVAGGTVSGVITRASKGAHVYFDTAAMANGGFFLTTAATPDPTTVAGQIWAKY